MVKREGKTTIWVSKETWEKLKSQKGEDETFEQAILRGVLG